MGVKIAVSFKILCFLSAEFEESGSENVFCRVFESVLTIEGALLEATQISGLPIVDALEPCKKFSASVNKGGFL